MGKESGKHYCDVTKVSLDRISKSVAKDIIVTHHYSHAWTTCKVALGVYYEDETMLFGSRRLIGCVVYGHPVGRDAAASICIGADRDSVLELTRLFIHDGYGANIESYVISQSFQWLRENMPHIKILLSYSDAGEGHLGKIYQATNWLYVGRSDEIALMPNYGISLTGPPDYDWIHSRTVAIKWGSRNVEHLRKEIGKDGYDRFWRMMESPKLRYVYLLAQNKRERKRLLKSLKHPQLPYPNEHDQFETDVQEIETIKPESYSKSNFW